MATNTCVLTGHFVRPNDTDLSNGRVELELNDYDLDSGEVIATSKITANLDAGGNMSIPVWPAQAGQRGTYYKVTLVWNTSRGEKRLPLGAIQPPDEATADIWGLLDAPLLVEAVYWSTLTQEEYDAAIAAKDAAEAARDQITDYQKRFWTFEHPLAKEPLIVTSLRNQHVFYGPMVSVEGTPGQEYILQVITIGASHARLNTGDSTKRDVGRAMFVRRSYDGGQTWQDLEALPGQEDAGSTHTGYDWHGVQMIKTGTGRIIVFALRRDASDAVSNVVWRSDSGGDGFSGPTEVLSGAGLSFFPHSTLAVPAADGGHDTQNATFACYGGGQFRIAYTNDNGATWDHIVAGVPSGAEVLSEPHLFRAASGKYVCICRDDRTGSVYNAPVFTTATPLAGSWGPHVDSGLPIGANPPFVYVDADGLAHIYSRSIANRDLGIGGNRLAWASQDAETIYNNGGVISADWTDAGAMPGHFTGYIHHVKHLGEQVFNGTVEAYPWSTPDPSESGMLLWTRRQRAVLGLDVLRDQTPAKNLFDNAGVHYTPYGTSFSAIDNEMIAGRWEWEGKGGSYDVDIVRLPVELARPARNRVANGVQITTNTGVDYAELRQTFYGRDAVEFFANRAITIQASMFGSTPNSRIFARINYGSGGSPTQSESASNLFGPVSGLHHLSATVYTPDLGGKTIGDDAYITIGIDWPSAGATDIDCTLFDFVATVGAQARPILVVEPESEVPNLRQYAEVLSYGVNDEIMDLMRSTTSSGSARGRLDFAPKLKTPNTPEIITGSVSDVVVKQPLVSTDIAAPSAVVFDNISLISCRVRWDVSGDTLSKDVARLVASGPFEILVSVE